MSDNNPGSRGDSDGGSSFGEQNRPQYGEQSASSGSTSSSPYGEQSASPYGQQGQQSQYGGYPAQQEQYGGGYPGQQGYPGAPVENPGRTLGIVGFILAIFVAPVGLILSIVAMVKSKKAGMGNGFALAGIIVGAIITVLIILGIIGIVAFAVPLFEELAEACQGAAPGSTVEVQGQTMECVPQ